jgi:hypothetical protein
LLHIINACKNQKENEPTMTDVVSITLFPLMAVALYSLIVCFVMLVRQRMAIARALLLHAEEDLDKQEKEEEWKRERKESISSELTVNEWVPDDPPVESTEGDQDTPPSREAIEASQPTAPPTKSSPTSCAIGLGSDDCEPLATEEEEEMVGCAICLSPFTPQQLVCESNNSACQHVFHKDCMVEWLMKHQDTCPMCREVYLLKAESEENGYQVES